MLRQFALVMIITAVMAACLGLPDVATARGPEKGGKRKGSIPAAHTKKAPDHTKKAPDHRDEVREKPAPNPSDRKGSSASHRKGKGRVETDTASARHRGHHDSPRHGRLPAELQEGFETWLRESLVEDLDRRFAYQRSDPFDERTFFGLNTLSIAVPTSSGSRSAVPSFSTTNLQEAGVDESDSIKFDGEFLYIAPTAYNAVSGEQKPIAIRVLRATDDPAQAEEVAEIEIPGISRVVGMYLLGSADEGDVRLLVVGSEQPRSGPVIPWKSPWEWGQRRTTLHLFNVNDPTEAQEQWSVFIDGQLVSTRRVGERLHLVTRASPYYQLDPLLDAEDALLDAREMALQTRDAKLFPQVVVNGGAPEPLVTSRRCFLPLANVNEIPRTPSLLTITSLDLRTPRRQASVCMGGMAEQIYSTTESLYLTARSTQGTIIHKFAYTERGPRYRGAGVVKGSLAGPERGFSLGEHDGVLGVVTDIQRSWFPRPIMIFPMPAPIRTLPIPTPIITIGTLPVPDPIFTIRTLPVPGSTLVIGTAPAPILIAPPKAVVKPPSRTSVPGLPVRPIMRHPIPDPDELDLGRYRLTLLRESLDHDFVLEEVSHLPNEGNPEPIGKPGDYIHGVRFMGERLYIVTYRKVDPLYAIDLSDPEMPRIAGQLQVPGFSDYLHPIGSDLLLGVGFDTIADVRNDWFQGIKVELFDVSDPSALESIGVVTVGRRASQSSALRDHHVISHLPAGPDGVHRFALPVQVHDGESLPGDRSSRYFPWVHTGLYLFEVEESDSPATAQLREVGAVIAAEAGDGSPRTDQYTHWDRSVIQGDAVHYVHGGRVWSGSWDDPEDSIGPQ